MTNVARRQAALALLCAATLTLGWRALSATFALALHNDAYTYILLILPISAALISLEWRSLRTKFVVSVRAGIAFPAIATLIACATIALSGSLPSDVWLSIAMFALVLSWIGAFVLCFGSQAARSVSFPLLFLFALVPLPQFLLDAVVALLQQASAWTADLLFSAFGVPVSQDGVLLTIPGLTLEVAQECSSIRSSSMLLVTTMVLAQLTLRSPWRKALLICLAVPLSIAKNGLRIFAIAMLGTRVDRRFITGPFHHQGGIVFFAIALVAIFVLLWVFRRGEKVMPALDSNPAKVAGQKIK